jgi:hypothetical protein
MSLFGEGRVTREMHRGQTWYAVKFMDRDVLGKETEMTVTRCITSSQALAIQKRYSDAINETARMLTPLKFTATGKPCGPRSTGKRGSKRAGEAFRKNHETSNALAEGLPLKSLT